MNIYIVGPMGSGKSTVGKIVARSLFLDFLDSDEETERIQVPASIGSSILREKRDLEKERLTNLKR